MSMRRWSRGSVRWLALLAAWSLPLAAQPAAPAPAPGPPAAPQPDTPPGDFYGNSLGGLFGGVPFNPEVFNPALPANPLGAGQSPSMFTAGRGPRKLTTSGNATIGFNAIKVNGRSDTFNNDQYGHNKAFTQDASLLLSGPLIKKLNLNVHAQIEQRSFGYNDVKPRWKLFWEDKNDRISVGDINPSLGNSNSFISFNRQLRGVMAEGQAGHNLQYTVFASQVQSSVRNETLSGNGTSGPYYLTYTPLVDGTAIVLLNGVRLQPGYGTTGDYTLNPSTGELDFTNSRIVTTADRIEVRYETQRRAGGPQDVLVGVKTSVNLFKRAHLGVSFLDQMAGSKSSASGPVKEAVTDTITVPTPSSGPFTVRVKPIIIGSESILVNGILQKRDTDYQINYTSGEIQFFQVLSEGTQILVRFQVLSTVDLSSGDRSLLGFDGGFGFGDKFGMQFEVATSSGKPSETSNPYSLASGSYNSYGTGANGMGLGSYTSGLGSLTTLGSSLGSYTGYGSTGTFGGTGFRGLAAQTTDALSRQTSGGTTSQGTQGSGGSAYRLSASSRLGWWSLQGEYKRVDASFSRVDSTSFFQNDNGLSLNLGFQPSTKFSITEQFSRTVRPLGSTTTTTTTSSSSTAAATGGKVNSNLNVTQLTWRFGPQSQFQALYNSQSNHGGGQGNNVSRVGFAVNHVTRGRLSLTGGLDSTTSGSTAQVTGLAGPQSVASHALQGRAGVGWSSSGGRFSTRADWSLASTRSNLSTNTGTNLTANLNWQALSWLKTSYSHSMSNSSSRSLTGRTSRQTTTSGVATDPLTGQALGVAQTPSSKQSSDNATLDFNLSRNLTFNTSWTHSVSDTGLLASSVTDGFSNTLHWQISTKMGVGLSYNPQRQTFTGTGDSTATSIFNTTWDWKVSGHLDMRSDWQSMNSTSHAKSTSSTASTSPNSHRTTIGTDWRWTLPASTVAFVSSVRRERSTGGSQAFSRLQAQAGWDVPITQTLSAKFGYDYTSYQSAVVQSSGSYNSHVFNANLAARF